MSSFPVFGSTHCRHPNMWGGSTMMWNLSSPPVPVSWKHEGQGPSHWVDRFTSGSRPSGHPAIHSSGVRRFRLPLERSARGGASSSGGGATKIGLLVALYRMTFPAARYRSRPISVCPLSGIRIRAAAGSMSRMARR